MSRRKKDRVRLRWSGSREALREHRQASAGVRNRAVPMRKSESRELKKSCKDVIASLSDIRNACHEYNIQVECMEFTTQKRPSLHVMFNGGGRRLLNWWPGSGLWIDASGKRGHCNVIADIIERAIVAV